MPAQAGAAPSTFSLRGSAEAPPPGLPSPRPTDRTPLHTPPRPPCPALPAPCPLPPPPLLAAGPIIGIDLGTTYSCVGIYKNGRVDIIPNDQGNRITPSYVAWDGEERLTGDAAKNQATINPTSTVFDAKRLIGRTFTDKTVQDDMKHWPFKVVNKNSRPMIEIPLKDGPKQFAAEEISAMVLSYMKKIAEVSGGGGAVRPRAQCATPLPCPSCCASPLSPRTLCPPPTLSPSSHRTTWARRSRLLSSLCLRTSMTPSARPPRTLAPSLAWL